MPPHQIPEAAQMLPLYTLAALKSAVMRDGVEVRSDERVWLMMNIGSMSTRQIDLYLYPNMIALHKFQVFFGLSACWSVWLVRNVI